MSVVSVGPGHGMGRELREAQSPARQRQGQLLPQSAFAGAQLRPSACAESLLVLYCDGRVSIGSKVRKACVGLSRKTWLMPRTDERKFAKTKTKNPLFCYMHKNYNLVNTLHEYFSVLFCSFGFLTQL